MSSLSFERVPKSLSIVMEIDGDTFHCGIIEDAAGEKVFVALYRKSGAPFNHPYFLPRVEFLERAWAHERVKQFIERERIDPAAVRRPSVDAMHAAAIRHLFSVPLAA